MDKILIDMGKSENKQDDLYAEMHNIKKKLGLMRQTKSVENVS